MNGRTDWPDFIPDFFSALDLLTGLRYFLHFCGMPEQLISLDRRVSIFLNHWLSPWLDTFMTGWSGKWIWLPLYALLLGYLFLRFRRNQFWYLLASVLLLIVLSDQTASALFKPLFERLRPCHDPAMLPLLRLPDGCGGLYGFASSHAANSMALAVFFMLLPSPKGIRFPGMLLLLWALINGWSRIYLGMHFVSDVLCGFAIGTFWAALLHAGLRKISVFDEKQVRS